MLSFITMAPHDLRKMGLSTRAMHGDTEAAKALGREVAPNIRCVRATLGSPYLTGLNVLSSYSVTTTFRHPTPAEAKLAGEWDPSEPSHDIYSRCALHQLDECLNSYALPGTPSRRSLVLSKRSRL